MDINKENSLNMYLVVIDQISTTPPATINAMPGFEQLFADFSSKALSIRAKNESLTASRTASAMIKTSSKEVAVTLAINLAACVTAYALSVDNTQLVQDMKFSKSILLRQRDTKTGDEIQFIISKGIEFLALLAPYGITQPQIDAIVSSLEEFNATIPSPRVITNVRKQTRRDITQLFIDCQDLLVRMDKLVKILELSNNEFYIAYFDSRKVVNYHGHKLALRGYVLDTNGNPISSVQVSIEDINKETKTTEKGYFEFKNLPAGIQYIGFTRVNYVQTSKSVGIIKGQRVNLEVTLENSDNSQDVA